MTTSNANWLRSSSGPLARIGLRDLESVLDQALGDDRPERRLVVYEEQMYRRFRHLQGRQDFDADWPGVTSTVATSCIASGKMDRSTLVRVDRLQSALFANAAAPPPSADSCDCIDWPNPRRGWVRYVAWRHEQRWSARRSAS